MKKRNILIALAAVLVLIQFIRIDKTLPPSERDKDFIIAENAPPQVATMIKNACYDCHSHQTKYPWYTNVAPLSWWIQGHINGGRQHLNMSTWTNYDAEKRSHKLEEIAEEVLERHMPMKSYTFLHPEAKFSDEEIKQIADWAESVK